MKRVVLLGFLVCLLLSACGSLGNKGGENSQAQDQTLKNLEKSREVLEKNNEDIKDANENIKKNDQEQKHAKETTKITVATKSNDLELEKYKNENAALKNQIKATAGLEDDLTKAYEKIAELEAEDQRKTQKILRLCIILGAVVFAVGLGFFFSLPAGAPKTLPIVGIIAGAGFSILCIVLTVIDKYKGPITIGLGVVLAAGIAYFMWQRKKNNDAKEAEAKEKELAKKALRQTIAATEHSKDLIDKHMGTKAHDLKTELFGTKNSNGVYGEHMDEDTVSLVANERKALIEEQHASVAA